MFSPNTGTFTWCNKGNKDFFQNKWKMGFDKWRFFFEANEKLYIHYIATHCLLPSFLKDNIVNIDTTHIPCVQIKGQFLNLDCERLVQYFSKLLKICKSCRWHIFIFGLLFKICQLVHKKLQISWTWIFLQIISWIALSTQTLFWCKKKLKKKHHMPCKPEYAGKLCISPIKN